MSKMLKFHHVGLFVPKEKYENTLKFYRDFLGFEEQYGGFDRGTHFMNLKFGDSWVEIEDAAETMDLLPAEADGIFEHIAIDVDDINSFIEEAKKLGCTVVFDPVDAEFANGKKARVSYIKGVCGEAIELFEWK